MNNKTYLLCYLKKDNATGRVLAKGNIPTKDDLNITNKESRMTPYYADVNNSSWKTSGVYYLLIEDDVLNENEKSDIKKEADALGIKYRDNISDEKLKERIQEFKLQE